MTLFYVRRVISAIEDLVKICVIEEQILVTNFSNVIPLCYVATFNFSYSERKMTDKNAVNSLYLENMRPCSGIHSSLVYIILSPDHG